MYLPAKIHDYQQFCKYSVYTLRVMQKNYLWFSLCYSCLCLHRKFFDPKAQRVAPQYPVRKIANKFGFSLGLH